MNPRDLFYYTIPRIKHSFAIWIAWRGMILILYPKLICLYVNVCPLLLGHQQVMALVDGFKSRSSQTFSFVFFFSNCCHDNTLKLDRNTCRVISIRAKSTVTPKRINPHWRKLEAEASVAVKLNELKLITSTTVAFCSLFWRYCP